jgi:hypothetical protein
MKRPGILAAILLAGGTLLAQAPDGRAILSGAGVTVPRRGGPEAAFDAWLVGPAPIPPGAITQLIVGMGPVGDAARVRNAYAFGVLAGRSARGVAPGELAGASVALITMLVSDDRATRIAGSRVAGRVFAAPIDGGPVPVRPTGLLEAVVMLLNSDDEKEQAASMEALGMLRETAAIPSLTDFYTRHRAKNNRQMAGTALEALVRIGDPQTAALVKDLATDGWGDRKDATGLIVAYARERFLKDGSAKVLQAAAADRTLGPRARAYLAELGLPTP